MKKEDIVSLAASAFILGMFTGHVITILAGLP